MALIQCRMAATPFILITILLSNAVAFALNQIITPSEALDINIAEDDVSLNLVVERPQYLTLIADGAGETNTRSNCAPRRAISSSPQPTTKALHLI